MEIERTYISSIRDLAQEWLRSSERPRVDPEVLIWWDELIGAWTADGRMPLLARRAGSRGKAIQHCSGRTIVITDHAPANWCLSSAICGWRPHLEEIGALLESGVFPIAVMLSREERLEARYTGVLRHRMSPPNLNTLGFKVCHVEDAGLKGAGPLERMDLPVLREHMRRFLAPRNMFLIPKQCAGLGELDEFRNAFRERTGQMALPA